MNALSNTTVLSNFASIGQLGILQKLFSTLYIPSNVYQEIQMGLEEGYSFYEGIDEEVYPIVSGGWIHMITMRDEELKIFSEFLKSLHHGEASCLAISLNRKWLLLTDDLSARKKARQHGITISGSIGCLVLCVERNLCSLEEANHWLCKMMEQGYRSPVTDIRPFLDNQESGE